MVVIVDALGLFAEMRENSEVAAVRVVVVLGNMEYHPAKDHIVYDDPNIQRKHREELALLLQVGSLLRLDGGEDL
jgi:hypothetical protein